MSEHFLKLHKFFYEAVKSGRKNFEVRRNDRGFQTGDKLVLRWHNPQNSYFEKEFDEDKFPNIHAEITYVLQGGMYGLDPDYCVLGIKVVIDES